MFPYFQVGPFPVFTYGLFLGLATLAAVWIIRRYAVVEGIEPAVASEAIILSAAAGLVGARVMEFAVNWQRYLGTPNGLKLLLLSAGVWYGGVMTAVPFGIWWFRKHKLPAAPMIDILGLVAAIADGVGRWGCLMSGCCWGKPTDLPWGITFPEIAQRLHRGLPSVPLHPTQIYESLLSFSILGVLVVLYRDKRFHGRIMATYVMLYALVRFALEFVRGDEERGFFMGTGLSTSQVLSLVLAAVALGAYLYLARRHRLSGEPDWKPASAPVPALAVAAGGGRRAKGARR